MTPLWRKIVIGLALGAALLFVANELVRFASKSDIVVKKEILTGSTFSVLASEAGLTADVANQILESAKSVYNLAQIKAGKELVFVYNSDGSLKELVYEINQDEKLQVEKIFPAESDQPSDGGVVLDQWKAERVPIEYTTEIEEVQGVIETSLYETVLSQGLDERLALELAEIFAWQIDFAGEIQKGDSFKVIYEKKFRDGVYDHPGRIFAAEFITSGEVSRGFYFEPSKQEGSPADLPAEASAKEGVLTKAGYYDEKGNSLQKELLKSPLQYKYISSGFTYRRWNPVSGGYSPHRGLDYAAPAGTPVVSVGNGTVVQAGWRGAYGIAVEIRHNDTYTTIYGHFSSLARGIRTGAKVNQGQVIGYVGSTGMATGPHLHFELHKFGSFVNPLTVKIPPGEPVKDGDRSQFEEIVSKYTKELANL